jgi:hypothetical protein
VSLILEIRSIKVAAALIDRLFSVVSCLVLPSLATFGAVWLLEGAPSATVLSNQVANAQAGSYVHLAPNLSVRTAAKKAIYTLWLVDDKGDTIYVFPEQQVADPSNVSFSRDITLPENLKPGRYHVRGELLYPFNPFKTGVVNLDLATLYIQQPVAQ